MTLGMGTWTVCLWQGGLVAYATLYMNTYKEVTAHEEDWVRQFSDKCDEW